MQLTTALCVVASLDSISCPQSIFSKHRKEKRTENIEDKKNSRPTYPVEHTKRHPFHSMTSTGETIPGQHGICQSLTGRAPVVALEAPLPSDHFAPSCSASSLVTIRYQRSACALRNHNLKREHTFNCCLCSSATASTSAI